MTLAELISTVDHAKCKADEAKVPYHKVAVKVIVKNDSDSTLDLYPGPIQCAGDNPSLLLEAE